MGWIIATLIFCIFVYSLCKASKDADEWMENLIEDMKKEAKITNKAVGWDFDRWEWYDKDENEI